jgi:cold shock CspA family protein/ribosome-associated translation inhibitor RaiA
MKTEPQIIFRNIDPDPETRDRILQHFAELDRICDSITSCRVTIAMPHQHHRSGNHYEVRIDLKAPDREMTASCEAPEHAEGRELEVTVRDAFDALRRKLENYMHRRRREVKKHDGLPHARIRMVLPHADHGFLETHDGREIYFHRNSVVDGAFDSLRSGMEVAFVEQQGEKGPQASTVRVLSKAH